MDIPVSIVIPVYNEKERIGETLDRLGSFCQKNFARHEIIVVDDGSTDGSAKYIEKTAPSRPIRIIRFPKNRGKGAAVKAGVLSSKGRYCFFTDADLPYPLRAFSEAMAVFSQRKCDLICGRRNHAAGHTANPRKRPRKLMGQIFSKLVSGALRIPLIDTQCGFKGFTRDAASAVFSRLQTDRYAFDVEIFILAEHLNLKMCRLDVSEVRGRGSKIRIMRDSFTMVLELINIARLYNEFLEKR